MPDQPSKPSATDQAIDVATKLFVPGSGAVSIFFLFQSDIPKAIISGVISLGAGLLTTFGEGLMQPIKESLKSRGKKQGQKIDQVLDRFEAKVTRFEDQYKTAIKIHCTDLVVEGFQDLPGLALADVFVPLRMESEIDFLTQGVKAIWDFLPRNIPISPSFPYRRIVILAKPGYGKTTLLRHVAFSYVHELTEGIASLIPILLRLREIHNFIAGIKLNENHTEQLVDLLEVIMVHHKNHPEFKALDLRVQWFKDQIEAGSCLVILDGLDEVPKNRRQLVRQWIDEQMRRYSKTPFILTSRPHGFELQPDDPSYPIQVDLKLKVLEFNPDDKRDFVNKWYQAAIWRTKWKPILDQTLEQLKSSALPLEQIEIRKETEIEQIKIKSQAEADEYAKNLNDQLIQNPALNKLAENPLLITMITCTHRAQTELPRHRIEIYEKICNLLLGTRPFTKKQPVTLNATENKVILQSLAWNLLQQESTLFTPQQGSQWLKRSLDRCLKDRSLTVSEFLKEMTDITGLLVEKEPEKYEFSHQTFQEYFAAHYLRERNESGQKSILENLSNDRWEEVISFYAAMGDATPIIEAILAQSHHPFAYVLKLAERCKNEGREVNPSTIAKLNEVLLNAAQQSTTELSAEIVLEQRFQNLTPLSETTAISEPITWGEYRLFLEAQAAGQFHSEADPTTITGKIETEPVSNILWVDACWFGAWLATQPTLQDEDNVYFYRLPTEAEISQLTHSKLTLSGASPSHISTIRIVRENIHLRYRNLLNYLANKSWQAADEETYRLMITTVGKEEGQYFSREDIENFPCEDLRTLDQLWVSYSRTPEYPDGKFGFSVQKKIWLECGGRVDIETECKLGLRVGWKDRGRDRDGEIIFNKNKIYDLSTSVPGHLPIAPPVVELAWRDVGPPPAGKGRLFSRAAICEL